ncbi:MAG: hypothetical protein HRT81_12175 [Henriciella sp.]|nr:hypothetical protein [Henriciella sp.]
MQATASQVNTSVSTASPFVFDSIEDEPGEFILPALQRQAKASQRDHLLVGRRRRSKRRSAR